MIAVVSGLPRSGTSLMMQALSAGGLPLLTDDQRPADPSNPRGYLEYEPVKRLRQDVSWLPRAEGHGVKVIAQLLPALPVRADQPGAYRIVFMERELSEIIRSQNRMLERLGRPSGPAAALMQTFARQVAQVKQHLAGRGDCAVCYVEHRSMIEQPQATSAEVAAFFAEAGVPLDPEAMSQVVEPDLYRERAQ